MDTNKDEDEHQAVLEAYRAAKWETLHTDGPDPLRRELAQLLAYLESKPSPYMEHTDVNDAFREARAQILEEILRAHQETEPDDTLT